MQSSTPTRVLIVAYRTAATPTLVEAVRGSARSAGRARSRCSCPTCTGWTTSRPAPRRSSSSSWPSRCSRTPWAAAWTLSSGTTTPETAVRELLEGRDVDEIVVSTLPARVSRWLSRDLPGRLAALGPPVSVVTGPGVEPAADRRGRRGAVAARDVRLQLRPRRTEAPGRRSAAAAWRPGGWQPGHDRPSCERLTGPVSNLDPEPVGIEEEQRPIAWLSSRSSCGGKWMLTPSSLQRSYVSSTSWRLSTNTARCSMPTS